MDRSARSLKGIYVRESTGLVREVSHIDALIFNVIPAVPGAVLAVGMFWILTAFPGANIQVDLWITFAIACVIAIPVGLLTLAYPRTGGDYVMNSRVLHPTIALIGNLGIWASSILSIGYWTLWSLKMGLAPVFTTIGITQNSKTLIDIGNTISSKGGLLLIGLLMIFLIAGMLIKGTKFTMRVQFWFFVAGMLGLFIVAIVLLATSHDSFVSHWNSMMGKFTGSNDSYNYYLQQAQTAGINIPSGHAWSATLPGMGGVLAFSIWSWYSCIIAGEVKRAASRNHMWTMVGSVLLYIGAMSIIVGLLYRVAGEHWITAINALNGADAYKLPMPPFFTLFAAAVTHNWFMSLIIGLTLFAWFPLVAYIQFVQPIRALFAYAFDGLIPTKVADVNERTHTPILATLIITGLGVIMLVWAVFSTKFFQMVAYASITGYMAIFLMCLSATILPWRKRDLYRSSPARWEILGVPIMSIFGVLGMAGCTFAMTLFFKYRGLGLPSGPNGAYVLMGLAAVALIFYGIAYFWRRAKGQDLGLSYKNIPAE